MIFPSKPGLTQTPPYGYNNYCRLELNDLQIPLKGPSFVLYEYNIQLVKSPMSSMYPATKMNGSDKLFEGYRFPTSARSWSWSSNPSLAPLCGCVASIEILCLVQVLTLRLRLWPARAAICLTEDCQSFIYDRFQCKAINEPFIRSHREWRFM